MKDPRKKPVPPFPADQRMRRARRRRPIVLPGPPKNRYDLPVIGEDEFWRLTTIPHTAQNLRECAERGGHDWAVCLHPVWHDRNIVSYKRAGFAVCRHCGRYGW